MSAFTLDDLSRLLATESSDDEAEELTESVLDESFVDIGYDSLALLELLGKVQREYGVKLADDVVERMPTPRAAIDLVNAEVSGKAVAS